MSADISCGFAVAKGLVGEFLAFEVLGRLPSVVMVTVELGQWPVMPTPVSSQHQHRAQSGGGWVWGTRWGLSLLLTHNLVTV